MPLRIFIVDDHPLIRHGIAAILDAESDLQICGSSDRAEGVVDQLNKLQADIAIVDLSLHDQSGLALVRDIKEHVSKAKTVVLSVHDEAIYGVISLKAGAMGYVEKREASDRLVDAIRKVAGGEIAVSSIVTQQMLEETRSGQPGVTPEEALSERELEVLRMIGGGLESKEIASTIGVSRKTVDTYRERIKSKLRISNATRLVHFATCWASL